MTLPPRPALPPNGARDQWAAWFRAHAAAGSLAMQVDAAGDLIAIGEAGAVAPEELAPAALDLLRQDQIFASAWNAGAARDVAGISAMVASGSLCRAFDSDLARFLLANCIVAESPAEFVLTTARRQLLLQLTQSGEETIAAATRRFLAALARQCFLNEFCYWEEPDETVWVELLRESLAIILQGGGIPLAHLVSLYACYRPLAPLDFPAPVIAALQHHADLAPLIAGTVHAPRAEAAIAAALPVLTAVNGQVSRAVRLQYEENPYPRWTLAERSTPRPCREIMRAFPHLDRAAFGEVAAPRILVAGCGTGANILQMAAMFQDAAITAVDLSRASLAYAKRQTERLGMSIAYAQADILELPALGRQFDIVECVGVLHHMKDPVAGARALLACLRPGGIIRIGLYSAAGRHLVAPARRFAERGGYPSTPDGIRRFRRDVLRLQANAGAEAHPENFGTGAITALLDFYALSTCRDLVFHVQERGYTLSEMQAFIDELGARLVAFIAPDKLIAAMPGNATDPMNLTRLGEYERKGQFGGSVYAVLLQKPATI